MRVGFLFHGPVKIPMNLREYHISTELLKKGHDVLWFESQKEGNYAFPQEMPSTNIKSMKEIKLKGSRFIYPIYLSYILLINRIKIVWLNGWNYRDPYPLLLFCFILKALGLKIVYDPIDPVYEYSVAMEHNLSTREKTRLNRIMNRIYKLTDITFLVTGELKNLLIKNGAPPKKFHVAEWGTDLTRFNTSKENHSLREEYGIEDKFVVGWLGTMSPFKGIEEIILPLFKSLEDKIADICFLVGGKGKLEERFNSLKKELKAPLILTGEIPYSLAPSFTKALDIYLIAVNPNLEFSTSVRPVKLFDAMASGTPVIINRTEATLALQNTFKCLRYVEFTPLDYFQSVMDLYKNYRDAKNICLLDAEKAKMHSHQKVSKDVVDLFEAQL